MQVYFSHHVLMWTIAHVSAIRNVSPMFAYWCPVGEGNADGLSGLSLEEMEYNCPVASHQKPLSVTLWAMVVS